MFYHDHQFQRQRYRERFAEMRAEYQRAQAPSRRHSQSSAGVSFVRRIRSPRRQEHRRSPAYRA